MSEDVTKNFKDKLLEQIFAKLEAMDTRLQHVEQRAFDTKPIWERALAEIGLIKDDIGVLKQDLAVVKRDVAVLKEDVVVIKQDIGMLKEDVAGIKNELRVLNRKFEIVYSDMVHLRAEQSRAEIPL